MSLPILMRAALGMAHCTLGNNDANVQNPQPMRWSCVGVPAVVVDPAIADHPQVLGVVGRRCGLFELRVVPLTLVVRARASESVGIVESRRHDRFALVHTAATHQKVGTGDPHLAPRGPHAPAAGYCQVTIAPSTCAPGGTWQSIW